MDNPLTENLCPRCKRSLSGSAPAHYARSLVHGSKAGAGKGWFGIGKISVIAGLSGSGKSYWTYQLLEDVRQGQDFCGHKTNRSEYLVLLRDRSFEDAAETWMQQFGLSGDYKDLEFRHPEQYAVFSSRFSELSEEEKESSPDLVIEKYAQLHPEIRVVCVEGLDLWVPSKMMDPDKVEKALRGLQNVAKGRNIAILFTLGSPKTKGQDSYAGRDNLYGSTLTGRMSDTVVIASKHKKDDEGSPRVFDVLLRKAKSERFYFYWGEDDIFARVPEPGTAGGGRLPGETDAYAQLTAIAQKHVKRGRPVVYTTLGASWGYSDNTFDKWRKWAASPGVDLLRKVGNNYFLNASNLPGIGPSASDDAVAIF